MEKYLDKNSVLRLLQGVKTQIDKSKTNILDTKGVANGIASLDAGGNIPISQLGNLDTTFFEIVTELPTNIHNIKKHIYILKDNKDGDNNKYIEYIYTGNLEEDFNATLWEKLGDFVPTFDLQEYVKKNGAIAKLEFYDPACTGPNEDDDVPSKTSIRIEFADGSHKYIIVPEASAPINILSSSSESSDEKVNPLPYHGSAGFMSASDKGKLDEIDLNALTASINAANTAADNTNKTIQAANTATLGAENVDATITEGNVFEVTDRTGTKKSLDMSGIVSAKDTIKELQSSKIDKTSIVQESGSAEDKVISQKATSAAIADLNLKIGEFNESEEGTLYEQVQEAKNSGGGLSADAISMLVAILNSAVYVSNQSAAIEELRTELKKGGGSSSGVSRPQIVENYETYLVSITCEDGDAVNIYYTIDGSTPTSSSTLYSGEFSNREDCTIKAIAINKITGKKSTVVTFEYIAKTIDYIEFADTVIEAALLASTNPKIDTNSDGKIQKTEAAAATRLPNFNVNNNIISFDELEYFTGITTTPTFYSCKNFASVKLPKNGALTSISDSFVNGCAITSIDIPEGITSIGVSAFQNCPLGNIVLPSTLITIGNSAFKGTAITNVIIPDSVTTIEGNAFNSCRQLREIHIGEGVTSIGDVAFYAGYVGRRIYLPSTPPTLGGNVFIGISYQIFYVKSQAIKNAYMAIEAWSALGEANFVIES